MSLPGSSSAARQGLVTHFLRRAAQQRAGEQRAWGQVSLQKSLGCAERPNLARRDPTRSQGPAATPPSCWVSPRDELGVARGGGGRRAWPARYHLSVTLSVSAGRSSGGEPREELHRLSAGCRSVTGWEAVPLAPPRLRLRPVFSAGAGREGLCSDTPHTAPLSPLRVTRSPPEGISLGPQVSSGPGQGGLQGLCALSPRSFNSAAPRAAGTCSVTPLGLARGAGGVRGAAVSSPLPGAHSSG